MTDQQPEDLVLTFGKHNGESLRALALSDRSYVEWLSNQTSIKNSRAIPVLAARILAETAEAASKLDKYDLDPRYRQEYDADEIEQMRREDAAQAEQDAAEEAQFNEEHLVARWRGASGRAIQVEVYGVAGKPITVYVDLTTDEHLEYEVKDIRGLYEAERTNPRFADLVAVLDNKVGPCIGLTQERYDKLRALLARYNLTQP